MKETTKNIIIGTSLFGVTVLSLTGFGYSVSQMRAMRKAVINSTERIKDMTQIDIDQKMVDTLVRKAVREQAGTVAQNAANRAANEFTADMKNRVKQFLNNRVVDIDGQIAKHLTDNITGLDKQQILEDVTSQATDMLVEKLGNDLDGEVGKIGQVYKGLAAIMSLKGV